MLLTMPRLLWAKKYAYFVGWFMTTIYYPTLTSVLAWLSARYTMELFGSADVAGGTCLALSGLFPDF